MALSFSVLRQRDFRLLLFTRMLGMMALQAQAVVVGWQVYSLTHDYLTLGLVGLAEAVPAILCALVAGHIVDNSRPHRVFLTCLGVLALNALILCLVGGGYMAVPGGVLLWIFAGVFVSGLARSFVMPASFSLLPQIVTRAEIPAASAWLSSGFQIAAVTSPAIAGLLYGGYGARAAWLMPVVLVSLAFLMLASLSETPRRYRSAEKREPAVKSIKAGWAFILSSPVLLSVMALDMFAVLFGGAVAMLPAYANEVLHVGSQGLGALRAAPALGAVITALALAVRPMEIIRGQTLLLVIIGFGLCMIGFGISQIFWLSMLFLALSGAFDSVSMVVRGTLMQLLTPDHVRGRVSSVNAMFIISSNELGAFESGLAARLLGLVPSVVLGGFATLLVVAGAAGFTPKLRRIAVETKGKE